MKKWGIRKENRKVKSGGFVKKIVR